MAAVTCVPPETIVHQSPKAYPDREGLLGRVQTAVLWLTVLIAGECPDPPLPSKVAAYDAICAEQEAWLPEFTPEQVQFHGPVPVTAEAVHTEQRFADGVEARVAPFELPQTPSAFFGAEQVAATPPYCPEQVQSNHPSVPVTSMSAVVPCEQWFAVG